MRALKHKSERKGKAPASKRHRYATPLVNPRPTSAIASRTMQANRAKDTTPERILRKTLWGCGLRGYRLHSKDVPGRPDIAFRRHKVAIFVHGCFWHRCPRCRLGLPKNNRAFWIKKFRRNRARDQRKTRQLCNAGWTVLSVWECELKKEGRATPRILAQVLRAFAKV
jgi:DNA mismatch endonuclease, patch repair protein